MEDKDINKLSLLANIDIDREDIDKLQKDIDKIINHIDKLKEINIDDVEPTTHPFLQKLFLRDDIIQESLKRKTILKNTRHRSHGYFTVKRIIDE